MAEEDAEQTSETPRRIKIEEFSPQDMEEMKEILPSLSTGIFSGKGGGFRLQKFLKDGSTLRLDVGLDEKRAKISVLRKDKGKPKPEKAFEKITEIELDRNLKEVRLHNRREETYTIDGDGDRHVIRDKDRVASFNQDWSTKL